jgi:hypothetical protein
MIENDIPTERRKPVHILSIPTRSIHLFSTLVWLWPMASQRFRTFGRQIFRLYEDHPLVMNTIAGGGVYVAGEVSSQLQTKDLKKFTISDCEQVLEIGVLGAVENGVAMLTW